MARKTLLVAGLELLTLRSTSQHVHEGLFCVGILSTLVQLLSGRTQSPFLWPGYEPGPFKGVSIQTKPAPLLGLQHIATVPGQLLVGFIFFQRIFC